MVFRLVFTDPEGDHRSFTISHASSGELIQELQAIFRGHTDDNPEAGVFFATLFHVEFQNTGATEEAVIDNLTNTDYLRELRNWRLSAPGDWEPRFLEYAENRDTYREIGIVGT